MKRKHGEYSLGRSSGQYKPDNPFWYKHNNPYHSIGSATVADSVGNTFQPRYLPQQARIGISHNYTSPTSRPMAGMDEGFGTGLSPETKLKIEELKRLVYKYRQYHNNDPEEIVRLVVYNCINGDNTLLDNKLEQLRTIDSRLNDWS